MLLLGGTFIIDFLNQVSLKTKQKKLRTHVAQPQKQSVTTYFALLNSRNAVVILIYNPGCNTANKPRGLLEI